MLRLRLALTGSLALFLAAGFLMGQDSKSGPDDTPAPSGKVKGTLPANYGKLGLTDEQRQKVVKIHASFKSKIDALKEQMEDLSNQERVELNKVLNDTQRTRLRELRAREPKEKESTTTAKKDEKKDDKKEDKDKKDK
jgi:hypothetical protein